jgi:outer membrane murein-binding lipoprotein Lpp
MSPEKKVVKGGFRATLALIISIIALVFAVFAFNRAGGKQSDLNSQVRELKTKIEALKQETSQQVDKVRQETAKSIENFGKSLRGDKGKQ